jgi:hypothetical protein
MATGKNGKANTSKANTDKAVKGKGKDAKAEKATEIVVGELGEIYADKYVTAKFETVKGKDYLLIKCEVNKAKSGSGKSFTLVSLGGIKNGKCAEIDETFGSIGGYFSVLCGYTQGAKD